MVVPPTSPPLLKTLNPSLLDDDGIPSFILAASASSPAIGSKRRHDEAAAPKSDSVSKFFLATPLELARDKGAATLSVNVVTPPPSPRYRLRMRASSVDEIPPPQTMTTSTPTLISTNFMPKANHPVTPERINFDLMTDLSDQPDHASKKSSDNGDEKSHTSASAAVPTIGVASKRRKAMRRNSSFNALCA